MRDALGGIVSIQFILFFIVLVSSYLAFSVNYTKAFRAKNKIIDIYEAYQGDLTNSNAQDKINSYLQQIGYNPPDNYLTAIKSDCPKCDCSSGLYCVDTIVDSNNSTSTLDKKYAEVYTFIGIDFPIVRDIIANIQFLRVKGSSKTITTYK